MRPDALLPLGDMARHARRSVLKRVLDRLKRDGVLKTLGFLREKLVRIQKHVVYCADCAAVPEPQWLPGEKVVISSYRNLWGDALCKALLSIYTENAEYLRAIVDGEAEGLAVVRDGKLVHYGFLMHRNKTARLLGFGYGTALLGNAFTVPEYRGRGCQARSVAARIKMAQKAGLRSVISETSYDNAASQRNLAKAGMELLGRMDLLVVLNMLVIRYKRPRNSVPLLGFCP
jgi:RimJ/RimL family protein N-acetyltransferase